MDNKKLKKLIQAKITYYQNLEMIAFVEELRHILEHVED
jgi:hypothetical protein